MNYKLKLLLCITALTTILTGCGDSSSNTADNQDSSAQNSSTETAEITTSNSNQDDFFWQLEILIAERTANLANTQSFTLYDGIIDNVDYTLDAGEGNEFLILELVIDKAGAGGNNFDWNDLYVLDDNDNKFFRMENDKFLEDYNLPRLNGTNLTLGGNQGYICLEIPSNTSGLQLVHETEDGINTLSITTK